MRSGKSVRLVLASILVIMPALLWGCGRSETRATSAPPAPAQPAFVPDTKPVPAVKWRDAEVPAGTPIRLSLIDHLDSQSAHEGDAFRVLVTDAVMIDGAVTLPSGSNILGVVRDVVPASPGFKGAGGMLLLEFNRIETPTGASAPLKARVTDLVSLRSPAVLAGTSAPGAITAGAKGREVVLTPNTTLTVVLAEPLRIKVKE